MRYGLRSLEDRRNAAFRVYVRAPAVLNIDKTDSIAVTIEPIASLPAETQVVARIGIPAGVCIDEQKLAVEEPGQNIHGVNDDESHRESRHSASCGQALDRQGRAGGSPAGCG